jgi:hypothetical protein
MVFLFVFKNKRKPLNIYYRKSDLLGHYEDILDFNNENKINRQYSNDLYYKVNDNRKRSSELYNTLYDDRNNNERIECNDCIEILPPTRQPPGLDETTTSTREPLPSYCSNHDQDQVSLKNESKTKRNSLLAWFFVLLLISILLALLFYFFNGHGHDPKNQTHSTFETRMRTSLFLKFFKNLFPKNFS